VSWGEVGDVKGRGESEEWEEVLCVERKEEWVKKRKGEVHVDFFNAKDWSRVAWTWFVCVMKQTKPGHACIVRKKGQQHKQGRTFTFYTFSTVSQCHPHHKQRKERAKLLRE